MSSNTNLKSAKILILELAHLPTNKINHLVVHCPTINDLKNELRKYKESILTIACTSDKLNELSSVLTDISLDTLYVLNVGEKLDIVTEPWWNKITIVYNEKQLMRHLCTKSMLCYYNEGMKHRKNGNIGLCNTCILNALDALHYSAKFT